MLKYQKDRNWNLLWWCSFSKSLGSTLCCLTNLYPSCAYLDFSIQGGRYCSCWPCKHRVSWQRVLPIAGGEQRDQKRLDLEPTRKIHKVSFMPLAFGHGAKTKWSENLKLGDMISWCTPLYQSSSSARLPELICLKWHSADQQLYHAFPGPCCKLITS